MKFDYSKTINEQLPTFEYYKDRYCSYELELLKDRKEIERLNNKINSIFSNFEQFINSYKNDNLDDFFIVLRLSEVIEFYNDLKEVIKSETN